MQMWAVMLLSVYTSSGVNENPIPSLSVKRYGRLVSYKKCYTNKIPFPFFFVLVSMSTVTFVCGELKIKLLRVYSNL